MSEFHRSTAEKLFALVNRAASVRAAMRSALADLAPPTLIVGGGKAAKIMATTVASRFPGVIGALAVPRPHAGALSGIRFVGAGHPLPDEGSVEAVTTQEAYLRGSAEPVLFLLSGGATSLLGAPVEGLTLDELRETYRALLGSGLSIHEMNAVRRRLTRWGGGKLARRLDRPVVSLVVSDVLDDDLTVIGSGPLTPDPVGPGQVLALAERARVPERVRAFLRERMPVHPPPGDAVFAAVRSRIVLSNRTVVAQTAAELGARVVGPFTGNVAATADAWAGLLKGAPGIYCAGAEPTVVLPERSGRGGRNQHLLLELALRAPQGSDWLFTAVATDGIDGNSNNAGGWLTSEIASRRASEAAPFRNDFASADACEAWGIAFPGGPTGTNVADVHVAVVGREALAALDASLRVRFLK